MEERNFGISNKLSCPIPGMKSGPLKGQVVDYSYIYLNNGFEIMREGFNERIKFICPFIDIGNCIQIEKPCPINRALEAK